MRGSLRLIFDTSGLDRLDRYFDKLDLALQKVEQVLPGEFAEYLAREFREAIRKGGTEGKTGGGRFHDTEAYWREFLGKPKSMGVLQWTGGGIGGIDAEKGIDSGTVKAPKHLAAFSKSSGHEDLEIRETFLVDERGFKVPSDKVAAASIRIRRTKIYDLDDPVQSKRFWRQRKRGFKSPVWVKKTIVRRPRDWARVFPEDYTWLRAEGGNMLKRFGGVV